jgi:carboxypeptidase family protein
MPRSLVRWSAAAILLALAGIVQAAGNCAVRGVVQRQSAVVPGVWVTLSRGDVLSARALTGSDGRFFMPNLETGTYAVRVLRDEQTLFTGEVQLASGTQDYDIALP